jgi:hypothetical protein
MRQFYRMAEEVGLLRQKPEVRSVKRAPARAVTREVLDVARYITDVTAQLEALAIAAHLDQLAYFLGTGKRKAKYWFASAASPKPSAWRMNPTSPLLDCIAIAIRSIEIH